MIKLGVIEDDFEYRRNLKTLFELSDLTEIVFAAGTITDGINLLKKHLDIDVLVLDIGLPNITGIEGIPIFKKVKPDLDIMILTSYEEEEKIVRALCAGASAYISKKERLNEIINAIQIVANGGSYMSPSVAREIVHFFVNGMVKKPVINLTERQKEIIEMIIEGKTYKTISKELFISLDTVRYHTKKLFQELHAKNKAEAIAKYIKANA